MGKENILEYRQRLDKTLASPEFSDEDYIKSSVRNQLLRSSPSDIQDYVENILERKTKEASNFLDTLRSVGNDKVVSKTHGAPHGDWKLKQDTDEYRVMYREGPQGSPFHTLLVEGYVDGPVDTCLCLSMEAALYSKWWPQFSFPAFKINAANCLQKVRIGEQICLVRMKVPWPLSAREVIVHYFELEFFEDDLIIVILDTISDIESVDKKTHGFTKDGLPEADDIVRIDLVGGFALQKVTSNRSYFRTMATIDVKVDFIPPSFINFVSRQLIGSGFKLYQKAVASVAKGDEDFGKALKDPLYTRIREGLNHENKQKEALEQEKMESEEAVQIFSEEPSTESQQDDMELKNHISFSEHSDRLTGVGQTPLSEIDEEEIKQETMFEGDGDGLNHIEIEQEIKLEGYGINHIEIKQETKIEEDDENINHIDQSSTSQTVAQSHDSKEKRIFIRPQVEHALSILNDVISLVREGGLSFQTWYGVHSTDHQLPNMERVAVDVDTTCSQHESTTEVSPETPKRAKMVTGDVDTACSQHESTGEVSPETTKQVNSMVALDEDEHGSAFVDLRFTTEDSPQKEVNHNRLVQTSPKQLSPSSETAQGDTFKDNEVATLKANSIHGVDINSSKKFKQKKKHRVCCFHFFGP